MRRFGESILYRVPISFFQKIRFFLFGQDFIGAQIRFSHLKIALQYIKNTPMTILDAGCGTGDFSFYISEKYPNSTVYAYDIIDKTLQKNIDVQNIFGLKNIFFQQMNLLKLNEKNRYDFIFSIGMLIYFTKKETKKILINFTHALQKNGYLYLDIPQEDFLEVNFINPKYYSTYYNALKKENSGDLYTYQEMKALLYDLGYEIIFTNKSFSYPGKLAWEMDNILRERMYFKIRHLFLPVLKFLANLDARTKHKKGCCFVILARKRDS